MDFKSKWKIRRWALSILYSLFGVTMFLIVTFVIRVEKFNQFYQWMYKSEVLKKAGGFDIVSNHYYSTALLPLLYLLPVAIILDLLTRGYYAKID